MAMGQFDSGAQAAPMAEINTTPLVDVMLVLLIIFMICTPLMTQSVKINLPRAAGAATTEKPDAVQLAIDSSGAVSWNHEAVADDVLQQRLEVAAQQQPQPSLHLAADREVRYERVAQVMALAHEVGVQQLGFVMLAGTATAPAATLH